MESDAFKFNGIKILNLVFDYTYMGLLVMCFLLSMGNRPQGCVVYTSLPFRTGTNCPRAVQNGSIQQP